VAAERFLGAVGHPLHSRSGGRKVTVTGQAGFPFYEKRKEPTMTLSGANRVPITMLGAAGAGALLWLAGAHVDRSTTGGYWAATGLVVAAGLVFGLSQLRGTGGHPPAMLLFGFVPVLIVAGWVIVGMQPNSNWFAHHVRSWSGDIGVGSVVRSLGTWIGVLAFGIGATLATAAEPFGSRRRLAQPTPADHEVPTPQPQPQPEPVPQPDPKPEPEPVGEETLVR